MSENYNQAALTLTQWLAEQWYNPKDPEGLQRMYDSFGEAHAMIEEFLGVGRVLRRFRTWDAARRLGSRNSGHTGGARKLSHRTPAHS